MRRPPGKSWTTRGASPSCCTGINAPALQGTNTIFFIFPIIEFDQISSVNSPIDYGITDSRASSETPSPAPGKFSPSKRPSLVIQTGKKETVIDGYSQVQPQPRYASPQITVINHDDVKPVHRLSKQSSSIESATIHSHTPECAHHVHLPRAGSPQSNGLIECDFHCCALHEEGIHFLIISRAPTF